MSEHVPLGAAALALSRGRRRLGLASGVRGRSGAEGHRFRIVGVAW